MASNELVSTLYMVHLIVLQNKSAELVVSLARKRKRDHFKPAENLNYSLCRQGNTKTTRKTTAIAERIESLSKNNS